MADAKTLWDNGGMPKSSIAKTAFGGILSLLSLLNYAYGWLRSFDWLAKNHPNILAGLMTPQVFYTLTIIGVSCSLWGLWEIWQFRKASGNDAGGVSSGNRTSGPRSPISTGDNSPAVGSVSAGRNAFFGGTHYHGDEHGDKPKGSLSLMFDPDDPKCVRWEDSILREYRVKVVNTTGAPARGVHVKIEGAVPSLPNFLGARLRVHHGLEHESAKDLAVGVSEYFNLMEYNPYDISGHPVIHICHTAKATLPVQVRVENYELRLKAYSAEATSDELVVKFEELARGDSRLLVLTAQRIINPPMVGGREPGDAETGLMALLNQERPEVVLDYSYVEGSPDYASRLVGFRNVSTKHTAYGLTVDEIELMTRGPEEGAVNRNSKITFTKLDVIAPGDIAQMQAHLDGSGPLSRFSFRDVLLSFWNANAAIETLFDPIPLPLCVRYKDSSGTREFTRRCALVYDPAKKSISSQNISLEETYAANLVSRNERPTIS